MAKDKEEKNQEKQEQKAPATPDKITNEKQAKELAKKYIPNKKEDRYEIIIKDGEEVKSDRCDVMYVTEDRNVFFKQNEGEARNHAKKLGIKLFTVKS